MKDVLIKAQKFVDLVRQAGIIVSTAYVFGSWVKDKASKDSDIDVCVVSPNFGDDFIEDMVKLRKISLNVNSRIEPIPFTPQDYNDPLGTLASEIRKNSIKLS